jgi:hypothetical protein
VSNLFRNIKGNNVEKVLSGFVSRILVFVLLAFSIAFAQDNELRTVENKSFRTGEKLYFDIDYGFFSVGKAIMSIPNSDSVFNRKTYHVKFTVRSMPFFDPFFKVRDKYESFIDSAGIFSWRFEQHVREGNYKKDYGAFLNQYTGIAQSEKKETKIEPYTHDIISAFYYTRTLDFSNMREGDRIELQNFFADKVNPLQVVYHGKDRIEVEAGEFDCIVIEPLVKEGGLLKSEGKILIWLTDDEARMPVMVKSKVVIGSITAELTKYEGVFGKLTSKLD